MVEEPYMDVVKEAVTAREAWVALEMQEKKKRLCQPRGRAYIRESLREREPEPELMGTWTVVNLEIRHKGALKQCK
eukprot:scaffold12337_cov19-Tisochrysis_lutea.AAC.2